MIILFAPAKIMNEEKAYDYRENLFEEKTNELVNTILTWKKDEFIDTFKISESLYNKVSAYYSKFSSNKAYLPFELYRGESYKAFDYQSLNSKEVEYLNSKVIIIDSLYGIIKPNSVIKPYRLDFHTKKLNIVSYWKKDINNYFSNLEDKVILSLASKEFSSILTKDKNVIDVRFIDVVRGVRKSISVFNKQMRGNLLRYIIKNKIDNIDELPNEIEGYTKEAKINNNEIIYIRYK